MQFMKLNLNKYFLTPFNLICPVLYKNKMNRDNSFRMTLIASIFLPSQSQK